MLGSARGRSGAANPIGLSKSRHGNGSNRKDEGRARSSSASRAGRTDGQGRTTAGKLARSISMTAGSSSFFAGGVNGNAGNGNGGGALSRANSQSSLCSEIHEPSWFSHAFDSGSHCAETLRLARRVEGVVGVVPPPPGVEDVEDMSMSLVGMEVSMTDVGADDNDVSEIEDEAAATGQVIRASCNHLAT